MSEPVLIDLGEVRQPSPDVPTGAPTSAAAGSRRRRGVAAAVALVSVVALAGSVPVPPTLVEARVPSAIGESMEVTGRHLFLIRQHANQRSAGTRTITAYALPEARRLWQIRMDLDEREYNGMFQVGDVLLLPWYDAGTGTGAVTALATESGRILWHRPGDLIGAGSDPGYRNPVLLFGRGGPDRPFGAPREVLAVDAVSGRPAWSYEPPRGAYLLSTWLPDGRTPSRVVTGLPSGRVEVRDAVTGRLLAAVDSGRRPPTEPSNRDEPPWLSVIDDLVVVTATDGETVTAYEVDRLERRWTARWPGVAWYGGAACGDLLCVSPPDRQTMAVDRRTGRTRWSATFGFLQSFGPVLLVSRKLGDYGSAQPLELVDAATGRTLRKLGDWALATRPLGGEPVLLAQAPIGRAWFAVVDPAAKDVRLLGMANNVVGNCQAGHNSVVCRRWDATIGVWRYR